MMRMHGHFDLGPGIAPEDYGRRLDGFCRHLQSLDLVAGWSFSRRVAHAGYDRDPPETHYHVTIGFADRAMEEACHAYVAADQEPLAILHRAMNRLVVAETTRFFLVEDVTVASTLAG